MRTIVLANDVGLSVIQANGPGDHKQIAWINAESLTDALAVDIGAALADLTEMAQRPQNRRKPRVRQDDGTVLEAVRSDDDTVEWQETTDTPALPRARFHAIAPPEAGKEMVRLNGVLVGLVGVQLLNIIRQYPKGIKARALWEEYGSVRKDGSQPGAASLRHLHRNGLVRKTGDRGSNVYYFPLRIKGID